MSKLPAQWNPPQPGTMIASDGSALLTEAGVVIQTEALADITIEDSIIVPKESTVWSAS